MPKEGALVVFVGDDLRPAERVCGLIGEGGLSLIAKAAAAERFKGKAKSVMSIPAPVGLGVERLVVVGSGMVGHRYGK